MARSYQAVGRVARGRLSEDLREALKQLPPAGLSRKLALEVAIGVRDTASIIAQVAGVRRTAPRLASSSTEEARAATPRKPTTPLKRAKATRR
jgi:hypothetical protein